MGNSRRRREPDRRTTTKDDPSGPQSAPLTLSLARSSPSKTDAYFSVKIAGFRAAAIVAWISAMLGQTSSR